VLIIAVFVVGLAIMALSGYKLSRLNDLQIRWGWLAVVALGIQVAIMSLWTHGWRLGHLLVHLGSYGALGAFLWVNRHIGWLWVVAVGTLTNAVAIAANGGVMPASASAISSSAVQSRGGFANSAVVGHPRLQILGDVIATPSWLPLHNVASIGDLLIVVGALLVVWRHTRHVQVAAV
jgi:hypothetical protein